MGRAEHRALPPRRMPIAHDVAAHATHSLRAGEAAAAAPAGAVSPVSSKQLIYR